MRRILPILAIVLSAALGVGVLGDPEMQHGPLAINTQAAVVLKHGILPGELRFKEERQVVEAGAEHGSFAYLAELRRWGPTDNHLAMLTTTPLAEGADAAISEDFAVAVYLPEGPRSASRAPRDDIRQGLAAGVELRTQRFIVYAWPRRTAERTLLFALREDGILYMHKVTADDVGRRPPWNALMGGLDWGAPPAAGWKPFAK